MAFSELSDLGSNPSVGALFTLPGTIYPFYWAWILGGIWFIITTSLYFKEKEKTAKENLLSSMSVACFAIIVLAVIGSIVGFISLEIMIYIFVLSTIIIGLLFLTSR